MFQYIGLGEILTMFVFPFIGLLLNIIWIVKCKDDDTEPKKPNAVD